MCRKKNLHAFCFCNNLVECQPISIIFEVCIAPNVCSYTTSAKMYCQISTCLATGTGFISTQLFICSQAQFWHFYSFDIFAEMHLKKMLKVYVVVWRHTYWLLTNNATDAPKAVVHEVNMEFTKLENNNLRNTNKTWQLKQDSQSKCSNCPPWVFTRRNQEQITR